MKPAIKKLWVEALRSGKYKQGKSALKVKTKKGFKYCCLGVLCELYQETHKKKLPEGENNAFDIEGAFRFDRETTFPPHKVVRWAGLSDRDPWLDFPSGKQFTLSELNDEEGKKFFTIANLIEKNL